MVFCGRSISSLKSWADNTNIANKQKSIDRLKSPFYNTDLVKGILRRNSHGDHRNLRSQKKRRQMGVSDKTVQKKIGTVQKKIGIVGFLPAMPTSFPKFSKKKVKSD